MKPAARAVWRRHHRVLQLIGACSLLLFSGGCARTPPKPPAHPEASAAPPRAAFDRALGLETFNRAWEIIYRTHFDTNFNGVDWPAVRQELQPRAEAAQDMDELRLVIQQMLDRLGQSHFALLPREWVNARNRPPPVSAPSGSKKTAVSRNTAPGEAEPETPQRFDRSGNAGFEFRLLNQEMTVVRVEPSLAVSGPMLKPGWIVERIGGLRVQQLAHEGAGAAKNRLAGLELWATLNALLQGPVASTVDLECRDETDQTVVCSVTRPRQAGEPVKLGNLPEIYSRLRKSELKAGPRVAGYIAFNSWMFPLAREFDQALDEQRAAAGIILDLRGNLGGAGGMIMGVSGHFLTNRVSLGTMRTRDTDLNFFANPRRVNAQGERVEPYAGPLAILVDELTYSASEVFAGGMQSLGRARIFGQKTVGGALPALFDRLPNGDVLLHAFADFITASGKRLEGAGVVPDLEVPLRREEIARGHDAVLEAALDWIEQGGRVINSEFRIQNRELRNGN